MSVTVERVIEWAGAGIIGGLVTVLSWFYRRGKTEAEWLTEEMADKRYPLRGEVYMREESDRRFANRETCAIQHAFLTERFKEVTDRIASEAAATRALIEALHKGD